MDNSYSVNESIWLAAACYAYMQYKSTSEIKISDVYLSATKIQEIATKYTNDSVQAARIHQHCNGDHENCNHRFLRRIAFTSGKPSFRVTACGEFAGDREWPEELSLTDEIKYENETISINELKKFIEGDYADFIRANVTHKTGKFGSWTIQSETVALKECDMTFFEHNVLVVTTEVRQFFDIDSLKDGDKRDIVLEYEGKKYNAYVDKKNSRICWRSDLKSAFAKFNDNKKYPICKFERKESNTYVVDFIGTNNQINYLGVLDYLENNQEVSYSSPEAVGLTAEEKEHLLEIKKRGQVAVSEMKKMVSLCNDKYGLNKCEPMSWLDGSNTKTRKYLWAQMKKTEFGDNPISVSLFVEMSSVTNRARYRVSLEIKNDGTNVQQMKKYHSFLDMPLQDESQLVYVSGSNEYGSPQKIDKDADTIKADIKDGNYKKVQLCRIIERDTNLTNHDYEIAILEAVEEIMPYYKHVVDDEEMLETMDLSGVEILQSDEETTIYDKNLILYGPPGTGKTYHSAIYAVAICDGKKVEDLKNYDDVMARYDELKAEGRIAFTTFHQSYGYEEFIEGIKPIVDSDKADIGYTIEPGVFKRFCIEASKKKVVTNDDTPDITNARVWCVLLDGAGESELKKKCFEEGSVRIAWKDSPQMIKEDTEGLSSKAKRILLNFQDEMEIGDVVVTQRSNETIDGIGIVTGEYEFEETEKEFARKRTVKWLMSGSEIPFKDMNGGYKLDRKSVYELTRVTADKVLSMVDDPQNLIVEDETKPYVFVIDEINRGNISKIFGELITLIETTKRAGMGEEMSAILPYSGEPFRVPSNVYILGTMNTADRSIALMDTALRRRFQFIEMMPKAQVLRDIGADKVGDLDVAQLLETINERIEFLYDREHTIGHAFFTSLKEDPSIKKLKSIFEKSVIPLLQEYFYEDYQKIQMVFGDNDEKKDPALKIISDEEVVAKNIFKGSVEDLIDLPPKKFKINTEVLDNLESYKQIM